MERLILASNRLPIRVTQRDDRLVIMPTDGGLASAVGSVFDPTHGLWIGCLGEKATPQAIAVAQYKNYFPIDLPEDTYQRYYTHVANRVLWPILHGLEPFEDASLNWADYVAANQIFADRLAEQAKPSDLIWIHDYHLLLVPGMLRQAGLTNRIGFFLHTPFRDHPFWATARGETILASLRQVDTLGVQTKRSLRSLKRALGQHQTAHAFPIGIDWKHFSRRPRLTPVFFEQMPPVDDRKLIFSLSRLDYTKGIPQQLEAIRLLAADPALASSFSFRLVVIPSRDHLPEYQDLKAEVEAAVEAINQLHPEPVIEYLYGTLGTEELLAAYRAAAIMLVTPIADGMNLISKEYLAANPHGILILSQEAGAAEQLQDALLVDPHQPELIADTIRQALTLQPSAHRNRRLRHIVRHQDVHNWADNFVRKLQSSRRKIITGSPKGI